MNKNIIGTLRDRLQQPLPGWSAQNMMSPISTEQYRESPDNAKKASVCALLYPDDQGELQLLYIKRTNNHPHDKHGGQISFPGGQQDPEDSGPKDTALREVEEEIGISRSHIDIIGQITPIYVYVSNFLVRTYIGYMERLPVLSLQESEVSRVISVPMSYLISEQALKNKDFKIRSLTFRDMPYYDVDGDTLWGATAMITSELVQILRSI